MRRRKFPDYGEDAGADVVPLGADTLAWLEARLRERDAAPDNGQRRAAEETIRETLFQHGLHEFTTTDGKRIRFSLYVHRQPGVSEEEVNAFQVANGQRAYGNAERWAWGLLKDGRALPDGFHDHFHEKWRMEVL